MSHQQSMKRFLSLSHSIRSNTRISHHSSPSVLPQQRSVYYPTTSRTEEHARKNVLKLYRDIMRMIPVVQERYNVPGSLHDMKMRVKLDFVRHKEPIPKDLVDAMVFRAYNELDEMERHFQTRPHVIKYFADYEPISRSLHAKKRPLSVAEMEAEEESKRVALDKMRSSEEEASKIISATTTTLSGTAGRAATVEAMEGRDTDATTLLRRMSGGSSKKTGN